MRPKKCVWYAANARSSESLRRIDAVALDLLEIIGVADPLPEMLRFLRQMAF